MQRLLCIVNSLNTGGAETFLMKLYRAIDKTQYQFDFCVSEPEEGFYEPEIRSMGGVVHHIVGKSTNPIRYARMLYAVVKDGGYRQVMRVGQHSITVTDLLIAKAAGAKRLIYRSANSSVGDGMLNRLSHRLLSLMPKVVPNVKIAPSDLAGEFMFGRRAVRNGQVLMLNNALDLSQFAFDPAVRSAVRASLGLDREFAVCHVGRFSQQKNHSFLLQIFRQIKESRPDARLYLIGTGELEQQVRENVEELGLSANVHFLGVRSDVSALLMGMDVMVFPSFYEGMPNTVIEAQATGLHCVISDTITKEAAVTDRVEYLSLSDDAALWAQRALVWAQEYERPDMQAQYKEKGYDISSSAAKFCSAVFV